MLDDLCGDLSTMYSWSFMSSPPLTMARSLNHIVRCGQHLVVVRLPNLGRIRDALAAIRVVKHLARLTARQHLVDQLFVVQPDDFIAIGNPNACKKSSLDGGVLLQRHLVKINAPDFNQPHRAL